MFPNLGYLSPAPCAGQQYEVLQNISPGKYLAWHPGRIRRILCQFVAPSLTTRSSLPPIRGRNDTTRCASARHLHAITFPSHLASLTVLLHHTPHPVSAVERAPKPWRTSHPYSRPMRARSSPNPVSSSFLPRSAQLLIPCS